MKGMAYTQHYTYGCRITLLYRQACWVKCGGRHLSQVPREAGCGKTIEVYENFNGPHVGYNKKYFCKDAQ